MNNFREFSLSESVAGQVNRTMLKAKLLILGFWKGGFDKKA